MQTVAHQMYDNHVKEALRSGKPVEYSMKDFLPEKQQTKKTTKKAASNNEICITIKEMKAHIEQIIPILEEQLEIDKRIGRDLMPTWNGLQSYKIMLCKITGKEYVCNMPR